MQDTDPAEYAKYLPYSPEGSPIGQYRCHSGSLDIMGVLHMVIRMDHWTWSNQGFCNHFVTNIPAKGIKFAWYLYLGPRLNMGML